MHNLMERQHTPFSNPKRKPVHSLYYQANHKYSFRLERLVSKCLNLAPKNRISLHNLLYEAKVGLQKWEDVYGSTEGVEVADLEESLRMPYLRQEEFRIGDMAPEEWGWRWAKERRMDDDDEGGEDGGEGGEAHVNEEEDVEVPHRTTCTMQ
jgi:hypothetical protein